MKINLHLVANIARKMFDEQSLEDLKAIKAHFGESYSEAKVVALIAVKMIARIAALEDAQPRALNGATDALDRLAAAGLALFEMPGSRPAVGE